MYQDLEWYRKRLEETSTFIQKHVHPDYGPCDGLRDGECSMCLDFFDTVKKVVRQNNQLRKAAREMINAWDGLINLKEILRNV
jgi:hypothetical protein